MKFEIEISDEEIRGALEKEFNDMATISGSYRASPVNGILRTVVRTQVEQAIESHDYSKAIVSLIDERADEEINKVVNAKLPGWISRQVKELLKYASANLLKTNDT